MKHSQHCSSVDVVVVAAVVVVPSRPSLSSETLFKTLQERNNMVRMLHLGDRIKRRGIILQAG